MEIDKTKRSFKLRSESLNMMRLRKMFERLDGNGDGMITVEEIATALRKMGMRVVISELRMTIREFVAGSENGTLALNFEEFSAFHAELGDRLLGSDAEDGVDHDVELMEAFRVFDEDGDGFISASELKAVLGRLGMLNGLEDEVERMISNADTNSDGFVEFSEFKHFMSFMPA